MGLDVGDKRIGLAISGGMGLLATPYSTIERRARHRDIAAILTVVQAKGVGQIVVGMPLSLDGSVGSQAKRTLEFCEALEAASPVPVWTWDERFSSVEAERLLRQAGVSPSRNKARLDAAAAAIILQSYLDAQRQSA